MTTNITPIISQLKTERDNIDKAIAVLESVSTPLSSVPEKRKYNRQVTAINAHRTGGMRHMSADARAKISKAAKARWRKWRQGQKAA